MLEKLPLIPISAPQLHLNRTSMDPLTTPGSYPFSGAGFG
jgi:hypothetical protein